MRRDVGYGRLTSVMSAPLRRLAVTAVVLVGLLATGGVALDRLAGDGPAAGDRTARSPAAADLRPPPMTLPDQPRLSESPVPRARGAPQRQPVLSLPGGFPSDGPGTFRFHPAAGEVQGSGGLLRRFRLGVEDGVDEDLSEFAAWVDATLADRRGWTAGGQVRFQRVPDQAGHDFTIYLATSATAARLCAQGGLDVIGSGLPDGGVSCRTPGRVILNLSRWRQSVPHYVAREVPLQVYRQMLLNHEVGHELGYGHRACPGAGELAPVMQQQTLSLAGCRPNPWPHP